MAYAALLSLSQAIEDVLPHDQDYISFSTKDQMDSLKGSIISLQEFLEAVPMKFTSKINPLESQLIDVAYQLEDLIESRDVKGWSPRVSTNDKRKNKSRKRRSPLVLTTVFNSCIKEVGAILQEAEKMKEIFKQQDTDISAHDSSTPSSSLVVKSGRNNAKLGLDYGLKKIVQRVKSPGESRTIIPIVGMGGIGKTTLARAVYEDQDIVRHFDVCLWVTISQQYNIQGILMRLLPEEQSDGRTVGTLIKRVYQKLHEKRFLIVLDDMWDEKAWNGIMTAIPNEMKGSRVILTTRLSYVAKTISSSSPQHQVSPMNEEQSWDLLREKVYGQKNCPPEFEAVGRKIAEKCKGLPLSIVVVAGMLRSNMNKNYWREVERNINKAAARAGDDGQLDGVLSLSYDNLPPRLKSCFLYFGAYPEDQRIRTDKLIRLWVAEGFVKPKASQTPEEIGEEYLEDLVKPKASQTLEEIGEEYLEDLVERSLVLVWEKTYDGKIKTCSIHDVLRDLSLIKAKQLKFLQCFTGNTGKHGGITFQSVIKSQMRRVSVFTNYDSLIFPHIKDTCSMCTRSLLFIGDVPWDDQLLSLTSRFKLLKVLHEVELSTESMLSHLFELTNLRLLHFSISREVVINVPESISKLQKLETLIVTSRKYWDDDDVMFTLPVDIWKIHKLRHIRLTVRFCTLLLPPTELSEAYPVLQHLQTLSVAKNVEFTEGLIIRMPNLKELGIGYEEDDLSGCVTMYGLKNLVRLRQLEDLYLGVLYRIGDPPCLPADFVFPNKLKSLDLWGSHLFSSWEQMSSIVGSLPDLQSLKLRFYVVEGGTWKLEEDQFKKLKYLQMESLELKCWEAESTHFPCLEVLVLRDLKYLEEIPVDIGNIHTLKNLTVERCSEAKQSAEEIREEQQSYANKLHVEIR